MVAVFPLALVVLFFLLLMAVAGGAGLAYRHRTAIRRNLRPILSTAVILGATGLAMVMLLGLFWGSVRKMQVAELPATLEGTNQSVLSMPTEVSIAISHDAGKTTKSPNTKATAIEAEDAPKIKATPRPDWMDKPIGRDGNVFRTILTIGPFVTPEECEENLPEHLRIGAHQYVQLYQAPGKAVNVDLPLSFVEQRVLCAKWLQPIVSPTVGPMVQMQVLLEFDSEARQMLDLLIRQRDVTGRMALTGLGAFTLLGLLAIAFGYLKTDQATGGRHRGLLRVGVAAGILFLLLAAMSVLAVS